MTTSRDENKFSVRLSALAGDERRPRNVHSRFIYIKICTPSYYIISFYRDVVAALCPTLFLVIRRTYTDVRWTGGVVCAIVVRERYGFSRNDCVYARKNRPAPFGFAERNFSTTASRTKPTDGDFS